jgi:hypothetical protein
MESLADGNGKRRISTRWGRLIAYGVTNSFGYPGGIAHCIRYASERAQGVPIVGYGSDDDLQMLASLGFKALGNLRVWIR